MEYALAAGAGRLLGTMVDPLTWGVALVVAYGARQQPWYIRVALAIGASIVIVFVFVTEIRPGDPSNPITALFTVIGTALWSLLFAGIAALRSRGRRGA